LIDFWAEWCEPCHVITHQLSQIAASHSNVAIRKAEVPDFEQPVFLEHLKGSPGLPAVWIFDETGTLVIKLAAVSPPKVLEELNKVLRCDDAHSEDEHDDQSEDQGDDHHHHH
jgi:thiol-disulfide isomerase/thioredoxin